MSREKGKNCPGAVEIEQENNYVSEDESVCNKDFPPRPVPQSLYAIQPFEVDEIVRIYLHYLNLFVGTVVNIFVTKYVASGDVSGRPGPAT